MKDSRVILERYKEYEDRVLVNEIMDHAKSCISGYTWRHTDFLDPRQRKIAGEILDMHRGICYGFYGGIEESERTVCVLYDENLEMEAEDIPITVLSINWSKSSRKLSHRDFLGSILGCGIKREKIGDIIIDEYRAYVACMSDITRYLLYNLNRIGNVPVTVNEAESIPKKAEKLKQIASTVASLRLDSLIATGYGVSRAKAAEAIKAGKAKVNWEDVESPSREMKQGDVISLRGKGRIVLEEISGTTKKDRIRIVVNKYL